MRLVTLRLFLLLISFCFFQSAKADIAVSNSVSSSIAISSKREESKSAYFLVIDIQGIATTSVKLEQRGQKLVLEVRQGNINKDSMAGGQLIRYSYSFPENANMDKLTRKNLRNRIKIAIPKYQ